MKETSFSFCKSSMCPGQKLNRLLSILWEDAQPSEPHQSGQEKNLFNSTHGESCFRVNMSFSCLIFSYLTLTVKCTSNLKGWGGWNSLFEAFAHRQLQYNLQTNLFWLNIVIILKVKSIFLINVYNSQTQPFIHPFIYFLEAKD